MCGGVSFTVQDKKQVIYFPNPYAQLPLRLKDGSISYYPWGRRKEQPGNLPQGGWARHDSILAGKWNKYHPTPVKIVVDEYMEKNRRKDSIWYDVKPGTYIQGLLARLNGVVLVYVVTVNPSFEMLKFHDRLPRVVSNI